jgi:hypothetical protein
MSPSKLRERERERERKEGVKREWRGEVAMIRYSLTIPNCV